MQYYLFHNIAALHGQYPHNVLLLFSAPASVCMPSLFGVLSTSYYRVTGFLEKAQNNFTPIQNARGVAQNEFAVAQNGWRAAQNEFTVAQNGRGAAQNEFVLAQNDRGVVQNEFAGAQNARGTAQNECAHTQNLISGSISMFIVIMFNLKPHLLWQKQGIYPDPTKTELFG